MKLRDVVRDRLLALVGDRADRDRAAGPDVGVGQRHPGALVHVGVAELHPLAAVADRAEHDLRAGLRLGHRHLEQPDVPQLQPAEALEDVGPPRAVVVLVAHRVAELPVVDDVDADLLLLLHELRDRGGQLLLVSGLVGVAAA